MNGVLEPAVGTQGLLRSLLGKCNQNSVNFQLGAEQRQIAHTPDGPFFNDIAVDHSPDRSCPNGEHGHDPLGQCPRTHDDHSGRGEGMEEIPHPDSAKSDDDHGDDHGEHELGCVCFRAMKRHMEQSVDRESKHATSTNSKGEIRISKKALGCIRRCVERYMPRVRGPRRQKWEKGVKGEVRPEPMD